MRGSLEAEFHATCRVIIIIIIFFFLLLLFFLPPSVLQSFECNDRVLAFTLEEAAMFVVPTGRFTDPLLINYWIYLADQTDIVAIMTRIIVIFLR